MNKSHYWRCNHCNTLIRGNNWYEITENDLNSKAVIVIQGKKYPSFTIFGGLRHFDVGKRLYLINDHLYIENTEEYQERINNE